MINVTAFLWNKVPICTFSCHVLFFFGVYFCFNLAYSSFFEVHIVYFRETKLVTLVIFE